ncbi:hypothetical protein EJ07DRAFT_152364 [Lizonia empirigonia]|nr:hypothetical protein EJ07DRAFT_152364 [Lizonia empirigonia]
MVPASNEQCALHFRRCCESAACRRPPSVISSIVSGNSDNSNDMYGTVRSHENYNFRDISTMRSPQVHATATRADARNTRYAPTTDRSFDEYGEWEPADRASPVSESLGCSPALFSSSYVLDNRFATVPYHVRPRLQPPYYGRSHVPYHERPRQHIPYHERPRHPRPSFSDQHTHVPYNEHPAPESFNHPSSYSGFDYAPRFGH